MARSRLGLKALGLCALVLALMGISTSAAQAEGAWGYKKTATSPLELFSNVLEPEVLLTLENNTSSLLFTTGGGTKVTILCTAAKFTEGGQLAGAGSILSGRIDFTGCVTLLNGTLSKPCEPHTGATKGLIRTEKGHGLIKLHELKPSGEKDHTVLLLPDTGTTLAVIETGEECAIGESVPVTGHLVIWDCEGNASFLTHKVEHLITEFPGLHGLSALGQPATISGTALAKLGGAHTGYLWAGLG